MAGLFILCSQMYDKTKEKMGGGPVFGLVNANWKELSKEQQNRYTGVYCGICRDIEARCSRLARVVLSYDMTFLALLHMSLYEPEETESSRTCMLHPLKPRCSIDNACVQYAADMNVALAYYKALDDHRDDGKHSAKLLASALEPHLQRIAEVYPRQCRAIASCIQELSAIEQRGESNPDIPASCFGRLMEELMVFRQDLWEKDLRGLGFSLGRFIYLADAMLDFDKDTKKGSYNVLHSQGKDTQKWEEYLLMAMGRCTEHYERLPLVQDKALLDNILYSGVWVQYRSKQREEDRHGAGSV